MIAASNLNSNYNNNGSVENKFEENSSKLGSKLARHIHIVCLFPDEFKKEDQVS